MVDQKVTEQDRDAVRVILDRLGPPALLRVLGGLVAAYYFQTRRGDAARRGLFGIAKDLEPAPEINVICENTGTSCVSRDGD